MGKGVHPSTLKTFKFRLQTEVKMRLSESCWCPSWKMMGNCELRLKAWAEHLRLDGLCSQDWLGTRAAPSSLCNSSSGDLKILKQSVLSAEVIPFTLLSEHSVSILSHKWGALSSRGPSVPWSTEGLGWGRGVLQEWIIQHLQAWSISSIYSPNLLF